MINNLKSGIPKAVGLAAAGLVTYEAFRAGTVKGYGDTDFQVANNICDVFVNHQKSSVNSSILESLKTSRRTQLLDERITEHFLRIKNVVGGIASEMMGYALPLGLCLGSILLKGKLSAICALGLIAGGTKLLITDVIGFNFGKKGI
jgi:hypothetical protein